MRPLRLRPRPRRVPSIVGGDRSARMRRWWLNLFGGMVFEFGRFEFSWVDAAYFSLSWGSLDWLGLVHTGTGIFFTGSGPFFFSSLYFVYDFVLMSMMVSPIAINHIKQLIVRSSPLSTQSAMANIGLHKKAQHTAPKTIPSKLRLILRLRGREPTTKPRRWRWRKPSKHLHRRRRHPHAHSHSRRGHTHSHPRRRWRRHNRLLLRKTRRRRRLRQRPRKLPLIRPLEPRHRRSGAEGYRRGWGACCYG